MIGFCLTPILILAIIISDISDMNLEGIYLEKARRLK
jgi:hypothetical protein